jgi:hypothetical protein
MDRRSLDSKEIRKLISREIRSRLFVDATEWGLPEGSDVVFEGDAVTQIRIPGHPGEHARYRAPRYFEIVVKERY